MSKLTGGGAGQKAWLRAPGFLNASSPLPWNAITGTSPTMSSEEKRIRRRRGGTRKRTGCFTCKDRHTRCDEKKPICSNCERLGLECREGEFINRSTWCQADTTNTLTSANNQQPSKIVNDEMTELPDVTTESPTASVLADPPRPTLTLTPEMVYLLREYRNGVATWMDIFDHCCTYQREISRRALTSELLLTCICAFTARQLGLQPTGAAWEPVAANYYTQALSHLIKQLNSPVLQDETLSAAILLSSYEVLATQGQEYRRHYEGATKLIRMYGIGAHSTGVDRANFWIWIRHEVTVSITHETPLQMSPKLWNVSWRGGETEEDALGNQILWLVGRGIDLVYGGEEGSDTGDLLRDAENWYSRLSGSFRGVRYGDSVEDGLHKMHFAVPAAAAAMIWYHTLHLLLYTNPVLMDVISNSKIQEHATEIVNISISGIPNQVRCFSIVPLYLAGKHIASITRKTRVWVLLDRIQSELGYHTHTRVQALQRLIEPIPSNDTCRRSLP